MFKSRNKTIPKNSIVLEPIPKNIFYEDVDTDCSVIYNVIESIKIENWEYVIETDLDSWDITFKSTYGLEVKSRLRKYGHYSDPDSIRLSWFKIRDTSNNNSISIDNFSIIKNDIILFLWDYIIQYYTNLNKDEEEKINEKMKNISSKLKTLNRSRRLDNILN
jgi:hypothetical protein